LAQRRVYTLRASILPLNLFDPLLLNALLPYCQCAHPPLLLLHEIAVINFD
jgi:hypothetical protein